MDDILIKWQKSVDCASKLLPYTDKSDEVLLCCHKVLCDVITHDVTKGIKIKETERDLTALWMQVEQMIVAIKFQHIGVSTQSMT
jgi:hypothetical protein